MGERAGVTGAAIRMMESRKRHGSIDLLRRLSEALGCDLDDLA
jgi:transcriptional regulator with XRE-family HTH domain